MNTMQPGAAARIKELIADPKDRIRLDDYVTDQLRTAIRALSADPFWTRPPEVTAESFQERLRFYEATVRPLVDAAILLGRWGGPDQVELLDKIFGRMGELNKRRDGAVAWAALRWFPIGLLTYAAGVAAISARNFAALRPVMLANVSPYRGQRVAIVVQLTDEMNKLREAFKLVPTHAKSFVPKSEYMFQALRAPLDETLFLGEGYEDNFDEFEILSALVYADLTEPDQGNVWGPPGRFGWKHRTGASPYDMFVRDAMNEGRNWGALRLGLFTGSIERFDELARSYRAFLSKLTWP